MNELIKIVLTASFTVAGAVVVFVIGQLLGKFVIDPVHELKKVLGEIRFALLFHAPAISTPVGDRASEDEAAKVLRRLSSELHTKVNSIPFYNICSRISHGFLPQKPNVHLASKLLMGLSNSVHQVDRYQKNPDRVEKVEKLLNFEPWEKESAS